MPVEKIDLRSTQSFSDFFLDYLDDHEALRPFYGLRPEVRCFEEQIGKKQLSDEKRKVLTEVLQEQYQSLDKSTVVSTNITELANPQTYTITTGHQLNIFTGPLYFIYKIATVVNACKTLKAKYPNYHFVPVYWMASEDHDFDEISYFNLFGKKHEWKTEQKGAVGRFKTDGLDEVLEAMPEQVQLFEEAYRKQGNLSDAARYYVNALFGDEGVIVVDADHAKLKAQFVSVIKDDLLHSTANDLVEATNKELETEGYKPQIYSREINFFYLQEGSRERIVKSDDGYEINNTSLKFTETEILAEVDRHPERFSPNVVMRPLYEEVILPNLAYVGGPAEMIYWMQLPKVFAHYETTFPILLPRNFALYINNATQKKLDKFGWTNEDLFKAGEDLKSEYLAKYGEKAMSLNGEVEDLQKVYDLLAEKAATVDASLKGFIAAEHAKAAKGLENIAKRLKKSEEQKHETALNQIQGIKDKLFPDGGLQERHDNFLNFYINNPDFVKEILASLDAFDLRMHIIR
ncbi:bacillithiol biosynthesis cysteine-adding enzyme BshC [Reichenbachiella carrageenanivorans]|uniref:Putative cysteine ligase BshC n=1 Tax=Reichenbachiella carrageenanivorans TaxID=2979869 RepID=A0ABY6D0L6_9BACT|nr:bacillithiol biosynthesis cysteine-adding enzyme BshC [Reichenbachiella carrageenanivorans]UXX79643.1 bacillithiol biosynthesis cysteine-adding enzyme BshC [Reichenbachiella carrageenanivorans]